MPPQAVIDATEGYFEEQDPIQRFVNENYVERSDGHLTASEIYQDFRFWCNENGEEIKSQRYLSAELMRLGIKRIKGSKANYYNLERK